MPRGSDGDSKTARSSATCPANPLAVALDVKDNFCSAGIQWRYGVMDLLTCSSQRTRGTHAWLSKRVLVYNDVGKTRQIGYAALLLSERRSDKLPSIGTVAQVEFRFRNFSGRKSHDGASHSPKQRFDHHRGHLAAERFHASGRRNDPDALNEIGLLATEEKLKHFDTDGSPIQFGSVRMTSKGQFAQDYETPYGTVSVLRHVYQTSEGGKTFCPLEEDARMILNATPKFAKLVSYKYAEAGADAVVNDLRECHHRKISNRYVKSLGDTVGEYAVAKEETWNYALPKFECTCASIAIGVDGTCMLLQEDGWRVAMAGTIAFYDAQGERLHTIYAGATPEYGKEKFHTKFQREVERVKEAYPNVPYIGLGDGAADNWSYLKPLTDQQTLDFYHASEYVGKAAVVIFKGAKRKRRGKHGWQISFIN